MDEDALKDCLEAVEAGIKGLDISQLTEDAWDDFKEEERDWEEAVEIAEQLGVDLGTLADDLVTDVASTLEAQVEGSSLIDAGAWYAVYEDAVAGAFDDMDMSAAEEQAEAMGSIPDEFMEALEDNEKIEDALEELDELVGEDFDGTAIEALEGDEAVAEAFEAIWEADEITEAQLDALTKAIADSEVASAEIEKVLDQATIIADEVISEVETTVDDVFTEKIPALMDAVKEAMPDSVDSMVDDAWSEVGETIEKVSSSGSATAVRSALEEQLAEVEEVVGSDTLTALVEKAEGLGETVSAAATELAEEQSGDDGAFHFTASIAAALAMVHVLAF